jgi:hypothetical protein
MSVKSFEKRIEMVNGALEEESGHVVCIEKGQRMRFGINYKARLIDITSYGINSYDSLYGFVCGIYAANYDNTLIFIDSLYKITEDQDIHAVEEFLVKLQNFSESNGVDITIMISADIETATESVRKYF